MIQDEGPFHGESDAVHCLPIALVFTIRQISSQPGHLLSLKTLPVDPHMRLEPGLSESLTKPPGLNKSGYRLTRGKEYP